MATGDLACQIITTRRTPSSTKRKLDSFDAARTARFALIGLTLHGPFVSSHGVCGGSCHASALLR